jgi:flagellar hook-associated protein 2
MALGATGQEALMAISSTGIGSGLDVTSIISQLSALEKQPLKALQTKATNLQTQLSVMGQIQSQVSALATAAGSLGSVLTWKGSTATTSNADALTVSAATGTAAASFSVEVSQLAKAQSLSLPAVPALPASIDQVGYGTLSIKVGSADAIAVTIADGEGTLTQIAAKINATTGVGVTATVLRDSSGKDNLLIRSNTTGTDSAFTIGVTEGTGGTLSVPSNLSRLSYTAGNFAMSATQPAQNVVGTLNGVAITSQKNTLADIVPGVTLNFLKTTTAPVEIVVAKDTAAINKSLQDFMAAYNALNATLNDATKYDAGTKTAGAFQGDSVATGLQRALRSLMGSTSATGSTFSRLADVGITAQLGGDLSIDNTKLTAAMVDVPNLQKLFTAFNGSDATNGFGLRVKDFSNGLLAATGAVSNKNDAIKKALDRNAADQTKVNTRATLMEERLKKQYSALDTKMASLTALNSYVAQQVTTWNKSTN